MKKVFLDLDGCFADFHGGVIRHTGNPITHYKGNENLLWAHLGEVDNLFDTLDVIHDSKRLFEYLLQFNHDYEFLTATPRPTGKLKTAAKDKENWVRRHLTHTIPVSTVVGGKNKVKFLQKHPGAILIDDYDRNIKLWNEHGGIGILHKTVDETIEQLKTIGF